MLFEKFLEKLIIMWSLIRPCWVDFSSKLNRHVDMIIRATRVDGYAEKNFKRVNIVYGATLCRKAKLIETIPWGKTLQHPLSNGP